MSRSDPERGRLLKLWVVFDQPRDFPHHVVVRVQAVGPAGIEHAFTACLYDTMVEVERDMRWLGLSWMPRDPDDDPFIVGVWL